MMRSHGAQIYNIVLKYVAICIYVKRRRTAIRATDTRSRAGALEGQYSRVTNVYDAWGTVDGVTNSNR